MQRIAIMIHALSPLHCGTGQGAEIIDLPIARMKSTGIPLVPGSSFKGVLRAAHQSAGNPNELGIFGPDTNNASSHAGALVMSDARLLLLPVRSFRGAFALVTSPILLQLATRDLELSGTAAPVVPKVASLQALTTLASPCVNVHGPKLYLGDIDLPAKGDSTVDAWAALITGFFPAAEREYIRSRLVVVDDDTMAFLWETATQIDARNRINISTGTVVDGALWYEESLPPETVLIAQASATKTREPGAPGLSASQVLDAVFDPAQPRTIQIGGKETVGRGLCRVYRGSVAGGV